MHVMRAPARPVCSQSLRILRSWFVVGKSGREMVCREVITIALQAAQLLYAWWVAPFWLIDFDLQGNGYSEGSKMRTKVGWFLSWRYWFHLFNYLHHKGNILSGCSVAVAQPTQSLGAYRNGLIYLGKACDRLGLSRTIAAHCAHGKWRLYTTTVSGGQLVTAFWRRTFWTSSGEYYTRVQTSSPFLVFLCLVDCVTLKVSWVVDVRWWDYGTLWVRNLPPYHAQQRSTDNTPSRVSAVLSAQPSLLTALLYRTRSIWATC